MEENEVIQIIALVSTFAFLILLFFGDLLGSDSDGSGAGGSEASAWSVSEFISIQSVAFSIMSFSWAWLFLSDWSMIARAAGTLGIGGVLVVLYLAGLKLLSKLNSKPYNPSFKPEYGMSGVVYLSIPSGEGQGVITILDKVLGDIELKASSFDGGPIPAGNDVTIIEVVNPNSVIVRPGRA